MCRILTICKCGEYSQFANVKNLTICKCEVKEYKQFINVHNINNL
jgi:hypothetical protein